MNWFLETFLPSLEKRMNNPKYPNQTILTDKQLDVCLKYFKPRQCHGDYGCFTNYEFETKTTSYQIFFRGKYNFLSKHTKEK